ncbi:MAG: hypothetical protein DI533_00005 [Cereibacter sphaeroides]|uniref:Uncharacterized protein n=1 Tax=Cereibacter sphaeroides TaxID=1063 RepID=A0A2W5SIG7_CERSP|nr:MAG: hypothetical protein DI533_00005 [Cereibacter sphaeroides]
MKKNMLVAEVDEEGRVIWVWRYDAGAVSAKPMQLGTAATAGLGSYETFGAPRQAIYDWIAAG